MLTNCDYGLTLNVLSLKLSLNAEPDCIVTDHPSEYPEGTKIYTNIFEALHDSTSGTTIVVDKECFLPTQAKEVPEGKRFHLVKENNDQAAVHGTTIGGRIMNNILYLGGGSFHIKGTKRGVIRSDQVCIWTGHGTEAYKNMIKLSNLRIECTGDNDDQYT